MSKERIVNLQRQNKIYRNALKAIITGYKDPEVVAENALDESERFDKIVPLQGLVGHGKNVYG